MTDPSLPVRFSARGFHFRADSEADFLRGCRSGLRMVEEEQGLLAADNRAVTSTAETRGAEAPEEPEGALGSDPHTFQHVEVDLPDDGLVVDIPPEERSRGWESPPRSPPEAPYQGRRPQRAVPPLPIPLDRPTGIGRGAGGQRERDVYTERPRVPGGRRQWPGSNLCFVCGEVGHWAQDCPSPNPQGPVCFLCRRPGHRRVDCPQVDQRRSNYQRRITECDARNDRARSYTLEIARGRARLLLRPPPPAVQRVPPPPLTQRE